MAESCNYHSGTEAIWLCQSCARNFCSHCIPGSSTNYPNGVPGCPLCRHGLQYFGASNRARPFWQMGFFYFRYALQPGPLSIIALAAGASLMISGPGILSLALLLGAIALVTRYNLLVIETLARGQLQAPALTDALDGRSGTLFLKVIAMTLIAGAVGFLFSRLGEGALQVYSIALSLFAPAAMIILALEGSLRATINPLKLLQFTLIIGWPYWLLWLATSAVSAAPGYLLLLVADNLPSWSIMPAVAASTSYFYIVTSAMMGYICLSRQQRLGISPEMEGEGEILEGAEFDRAKAQADTQILMREGRFDGARRTLVDALRRYPQDIPLNERYYRLLLATQDKKALRELGPHLLQKFVQLQRPHKAAELYLATEPKPVIDKSHLRHALAEALYHKRKFRPAAQLLNNLHKEDRDYGNLDQAYLLLAHIYLDGFNREDMAGKILAFLRRQYPDSPVQEQVRTLQNVLGAANSA